MAKYLSVNNSEEVLVPNKFKRDFKKTAEKLAKAKIQGMSDTKIAVLESKMASLKKQFKVYAKNQKERPERHHMEVKFGGVDENGNIRGSKSIKATALAVSGLAGGLTGFLIVGAVAATFLTGGLAALPSIAIASLAVAATASTIKDSVDIMRSLDEKKAAIQKEDKEFVQKQAEQRAKQKQKAGKKKDTFKGLTIVINKDRKTEKTKERAKVKSQKTKKKVSSARTI